MVRRLAIDDLYATAMPEDPAIRPDGGAVVYVLRTIDRDADRYVRELWWVDTGSAGAGSRRLTRGPDDRCPTWSPDGTRMAFLRAVDGRDQIWLMPAGGGEAKPLTDLPLGAGRPVWSPDGRTIAFAAPAEPDAPIGPVENQVVDHDSHPASEPVVVDRLGYKADGQGLADTTRAHLYVVDVDSGGLRRLTHGDWDAGGPAWSPDGTRLAFTGALDDDHDLTMRSAAYMLDVADPADRPRLAGPPTGSATAVTWTGDGQALIVAGRTDTEVGHTRLLRVPLPDGGTAGPTDPIDLTARLDRNVMIGAPAYPGGRPALASDGRTVYFCARNAGCTQLHAVDAAGGTPRPVYSVPGHEVSGLSVAQSADVAAVVVSGPTSFGEIATMTLPTGELIEHTGHGRGALCDVDLIAYTACEFTVSDGTVVHGWLLTDPDRDGPRPLLLDIHGGPHNAWGGTADPVHLYHQVLAARGWSVLVLNPRGSDGYGEAFYTAVCGAWGDADARDLLEPIDQLVADGTADSGRIAVTGYSYGGFMTSLLTGVDDRFAAAVAGGVVVDLVSMAGTSDVGHVFAAGEFGSPPWPDPDRLTALSPLRHVDRIHTPTLVLHGTDDQRCPIGQAEQWFSALRERGVDSRAVFYPGASHLFPFAGRPSHRADYNRRLVDWIERYTSPEGPRGSTPIDAEHWRRQLTNMTARYRVPGAALGILRVHPDADDELTVVSCGVLSADTGVPVTDDAVFQIGSLTKIATTTLIMALVDEGRLDLDQPVTDLLPDFRLTDAEVSAQVTIRHLVTHTSGIAGDVFTDTGRGDDCLQRYVAALADEPLAHPLGAMWSYCNAGFVVAGRIISELTGMTWEGAIQQRLFGPLGMAHTVTLPEDAIRFRAAVGHIGEADEPPAPTGTWGLPRAIGPAGLITASAADVLAFVRMHLTGGLADATRVLSSHSVEAMAAHQVDLPDGNSWGLGWGRYTWDGHLVLGHNGATIGQAAFLRVLPDQGLAVVLLTNGGNTADLYDELFREVFDELAGVSLPAAPVPPSPAPVVDLTPYVGTYERTGVRFDVFTRNDSAVLRQTVTGVLAKLQPDPVQEYDLVPVSDERYLIRDPGVRAWTPVTFVTGPHDQLYLHCGSRATPRRP